jgi:CheY-like chemotaxis protein
LNFSRNGGSEIEPPILEITLLATHVILVMSFAGMPPWDLFVLEAGDGAAALKILNSSHNIDLLITDVACLGL